MKRFVGLALLLSGIATAQPAGFSPTMPFGIPAYSTQSAVNSAGPGQTHAYNPYNYYYYYGSGGYGYSASGQPGPQGDSLPGYQKSQPQRTLPGYESSPSPRRKSDTLPTYNQR